MRAEMGSQFDLDNAEGWEADGLRDFGLMEDFGGLFADAKRVTVL